MRLCWKILIGIALITPLIALLVVGAAGFGPAGVVAGSFAAAIQGPAVAAGSAFAFLQSVGATVGLAVPAILAAGGFVLLIDEIIRIFRERRRGNTRAC